MGKTLQNIVLEMDRVYATIQGGSPNTLEIQGVCADLCIFHDNHIEDSAFGDTLRLANAMAQECIQATTEKLIIARFQSCYACATKLAQ